MDIALDWNGELLAGETDPRGWWGDLLAREKQTAATARRAEEYAAEALQWLVDDRIAAAVDIAAEWAPPPPRGRLRLDIAVRRPRGDTVKHRFNGVWRIV